MMGYRCTYVMLRCCQRTFMPLWLTGATLQFQIRTWHLVGNPEPLIANLQPHLKAAPLDN